MDAFWNKVKIFIRHFKIYAFDMVQDRVKNRGIAPILIVFIIFIFAYEIFLPESSVEPYASYLNILIKPPTSLFIGETSGIFIIGITDKFFNMISNITVNVEIYNIKVVNNDELIHCDYNYLILNFWTYEFIRSLNPCKIEMKGDIQVSDEGGFAYFKNFGFVKATQGSFYMYIQGQFSWLQTESFNILVSPSIHKVEVLNNPPNQIKINSILDPQPIMILYDLYGDPLPNSTITAISWPFGDYNMDMPQMFDPEVDKFAVLDGSVSQHSNEQGIASFYNLSIKGSTHSNVYILFVANGNQVICPWKKSTFPNFIIGKIKQRVFIPPIQILYQDEINLQVIQDISNLTIEGIQFSKQPILKLSKSKNEELIPIQGIVCIAILRGINGVIFPMGYQPHVPRGSPKSIFKGITGIYEVTSNLFSHSFIPINSTEEGIIEFSEMGISRGGNNQKFISQYGLSLRCGASKIMQYAWIQTSVSHIEILSIPKFASNFFSQFADDYQIESYSVGVYDKSYFQIFNKYADILQLTFKDKRGKESKIILRNYLDLSSQIPDYSINSDINGIINSKVILYSADTDSGNYIFSITIDEIIFESEFSSYMSFNRGISNTTCWNLNSISNSNYNIKDFDQINEISLFAFDLVGEVTLYDTFLEFFSVVTSNLIFSAIDIGPLNYVFKHNLYNYTISNYGSHNYPLALNNFYTGTYLEYLYFPNRINWFFFMSSSNQEGCRLLNPLVINYTNSINQVIIVEPKMIDFSHLYLGNNELHFNLKLTVIGINNQSLPFFPINLTFVIYEYPDFVTFYFLENKWESKLINPFNLMYPTIDSELQVFSIVNQDENQMTSINGDLNLKIQMNKFYLGNYTFSILVNGISTIPIQLKIEKTITKINIVSSPNNSENLLLFQTLPNPFIIHVETDQGSEPNLAVIVYFNIIQTVGYFQTNFGLDSSIVMNPNRLNFPNANGDATFSNLRVLGYDNYNVSGNCVNGYFFFKVGLNNIIISNISRIYTFCDSGFKIFAYNVYSNNLNLWNYLKSPIIIEFIELNTLNLLNSKQPLLFQSIIRSYEGDEISNKQSTNMVNSLYSQYFCIFESLNTFLKSNCTISSNEFYFLNQAPSTRYNIQLNEFAWNLITRKKRFELVVCILNFCNYSSLTLSAMKLISCDNSLHFEDQLPSSLEIDQKIVIKLNYTPSCSLEYFKCSIISEQILQNINSSINSIIYMISKNPYISDLYNLLSQSSRIEVNPYLVEAISSKEGKSKNVIKIISGQPGYYSFLCSTETGQELRSNSFYLDNKIFQIIYLSDNHLEIEIDFKDEGGIIKAYNKTFPEKIILSVKDKNNKSIMGMENELLVEVYDEKLYKESLGQSGDDNSISLQITNFINIILKGAITLNEAYFKIYVTCFNQVVIYELKKEIYIIDNVTIEFPKPGNYWMKFECKGITSEFSSVITINQTNFKSFVGFFLYYCKYIIIISLIFVLITNSSSFLLIFMIISEIIMIFDIVIYWAKNRNNLFQLIFGVILLLLGFLLLIFQIIMNFKQKEKSDFIKIKEKYLVNYTVRHIQKLFAEHSINFLVSKKRKDEGFPNFMRQDMSQENLLKEKKNGDSYLVAVSSKKSKFFLKVLSFFKIFIPFEDEEFFYFPQKFLIAISAAFFTLVAGIFLVLSRFFAFIDFVEYLQNVIANNIFAFINIILNIIESKLNYIPRSQELNTYYDAISEAVFILSGFKKSFKLSMILANVIVIIMFIISFSYLLKKYKSEIIKSRFSKKKIEKYNEYGISSSSGLTGLMVGNTAFSYLLITFLFALILGMTCNIYFWGFIWEYKNLLLYLIVPVILKFIIQLVLSNIIFKKSLDLNFTFLIQLYDILFLILSIMNSIISSFNRLIFGLIGLSFGMIRFDKKITAKWIEIPFLKDEIEESFRSMILQDITHCNPILLFSFIHLSMASSKLPQSKCIQKLWKSYLLIKFQTIRNLKKSIESQNKKDPS